MDIKNLTLNRPELEHLLSIYFDIKDLSQLTVQMQRSQSLNKNYKLSLGSKSVILKILCSRRAREDRVNEIHAMRIAAEINIAPNVLYTSDDLLVVTAFIEHLVFIPNLLSRDDTLKIIANLLGKLHYSQQKFFISAQPFDIASYYLQEAIKQGFSEKNIIKLIEENIIHLQENMGNVRATAPCHFDVNMKNILLPINTQHCYLIDWENAVNSDPFFDLASFCFYANLNEKQMHDFISFYLEKDDIEEELVIIHKYKKLCLLMMASWFCYKLAFNNRSTVSLNFSVPDFSELVIAYIAKDYQKNDPHFFEENLLQSCLKEFCQLAQQL